MLAWQKANREKYNARRRRWKNQNRERANKYERDRRAELRVLDPAKVRRAERSKSLRPYGLTIEQWEQLFDLQGRCCAICKATESGDGRWHTDHDDAVGKKAVRGILCVRCNLGIGQFRHRPEVLRAACAYLELPREYAK